MADMTKKDATKRDSGTKNEIETAENEEQATNGTRRKATLHVVVPRVTGTPMPCHTGFVVALAKLDGTPIPAVVAYQVTMTPAEGLTYDMIARPMSGDFARREGGAWHLVDGFDLFEETGTISYVDGLVFSGLAERVFTDFSDDDPTAFTWLIDLDELPAVTDRYDIPFEIEHFVTCVNASDRIGTPLFPCITCSLSRMGNAMIHGRYSSTPNASEDAGISTRKEHGENASEGGAWRWDLYDYLSVLVDADGNEILEFDEDQQLVRRLPGGLPVMTFSNRQAVANREAKRRGFPYEGTLDPFQQRTPRTRTVFDVNYRRLYWDGMQWVRNGDRYVLRNHDGDALIGLDVKQMRLFLANGEIARCEGDPGGMFEIALYLTNLASKSITNRDVTGMPVRNDR